MSNFLHQEHCEAAIRTLQVEYRKQLRKLCLSFTKFAETGKLQPDEGHGYLVALIDDWVDSQTLGSQQMFVALSSHYDAWKDEFGMEGIQTKEDNLSWHTIAYAAVKYDVLEMLQESFSVDVNDSRTWKAPK